MVKDNPAVSEWLSLAEVAGEYRIPPETLYWHRHAGTGPPSYRAGKRVRYRRSEVEAWLAGLGWHDRSERGSILRGSILDK